MARPTVMTKEIIDKICAALAGGESLSSICRADDMPARSTVLLAVVDDRDGFRTDYMRAREAAGFSHADSIVDIVNQVGGGQLEPNAAKAMMDGLKWAAERMASKHHAPNQKIDHTSSDGSMTPSPAIDTSGLSDETLSELMRARRSPRAK